MTTAMTAMRPAQSDGEAAAERPGRARLRIAVFTNAYPTISHTFIRNEIVALERQGIEVTRLTIRPGPASAVEEADRVEADRTLALMTGGGLRLAGSVAARFARSPRRFLSALRLTLSEPQRAAGRWRALAYFVQACRLADVMERTGVTHVHVHFGTNPAAIARLAGRLGDLTYSMTVHGPDEFDAPAALHLRAKIADARLVVAISDYGRSQLMRWARPADWPRIRVVRCGVASAFHKDAGENDGLRSATLVCVARLSAQKGLPLLLDAAALVARDRALSLRIVGDGELRAELTARIAALGLSDHIHLLGWRSVSEVRRELLAARALVLPSFAEGLPIVLMEAMALGRPVIATAIAGIPELVDDRVGWLVRAGSAGALADAMHGALDAQPGVLAGMAALGRERVRRDHDVDRNARRLAALLREAVA
jgi:glycosyltransferase involved in cell wall biosynthesis